MGSYRSWVVGLCLSIAACSDDDSGRSEEAVNAADASTFDGTKTADGGDSASDSGGKSESQSKASGGDSAKTTSGSGKMSEARNEDEDGKANESKEDGTSGDTKARPDTEAGSSSEGSSDKASGEPDDTATTTPPSDGDQFSLCSRAEGDCNKGLACQGPATGPLSPGRGFCSKICEADADCEGLAPEGTKYTCSTGAATNTCQIACAGPDDTGCPSGLTCVQTGRLRPGRVPAADRPDAGSADNGGSEGAAAGVFYCRHPFERSKTWGPCGDASHVCDTGLYCTSFWFGSVGHCTHSCETDANCEKPGSGATRSTCVTLVPGFGDNPAVKQCALDCSAATEDCPNGLTCIETRQPRSGDAGMEATSAPAWCR